MQIIFICLTTDALQPVPKMAIPPRRTHMLKRWIQTPPGVHQDANNNPAPRDINPPPLGEVHHSKMTTQICAKLPESSHPANCRQVQLTHDYTSLGTANLVSCALNRMFSLLTESLPYQSNVGFFFMEFLSNLKYAHVPWLGEFPTTFCSQSIDLLVTAMPYETSSEAQKCCW